MSLKPYPAYKDGGVAWLGQVPEHWEIAKFRHVFTESPEKIETEIVGKMLSVSGYRGIEIKEYDDENRKRLDEQLLGYRIVRRGQLVVNTMWLNYAGLGVSEHEGHVSPAYRSYWINDGFDDRFVHHMMRCGSFVLGYTSFLTGIRPNSLQMSRDDLMSFQVLKPPASEQTAIAAFLDRETSKIDDLIAEQEKLIALLAEKRQATISHAVTKGLNPDTPMKDSGVEWLGQIPAHWSASPLKYFVSLRSGGTPSKDNIAFWDGEIPWASAKDLKTEQLSDTIDHITEAAIQTGGASLVRAGSVLVVVRGMILARMFPVTETLVPMAINQDLKALEPSECVHTIYLSWLLRGSADESLRRLDEAGHGTKALRMESWTAMILPVPPLSEQIEIVHFIEVELAKLDELNTEAVRVIDLLKERRTALISAAVTGKIDVRRPSAEIIDLALVRRRVRGMLAVELIEKSQGRPTFGRTALQKHAYLAEAFADLHELGGRYVRNDYGPLDRDMIDDMESEAQAICGVVTQPPTGSNRSVTYLLSRAVGSLTAELAQQLGPERTTKLHRLHALLAPLNTHEVEGVATLFAVWNDFLIEKTDPSDDDIVNGFLNDWHPSKKANFNAQELHLRLKWMRDHDLVPTGTGPKTETGRLFA